MSITYLQQIISASFFRPAMKKICFYFEFIYKKLLLIDMVNLVKIKRYFKVSLKLRSIFFRFYITLIQKIHNLYIQVPLDELHVFQL